jgi:hypothetical protein
VAHRWSVGLVARASSQCGPCLDGDATAAQLGLDWLPTACWGAGVTIWSASCPTLRVGQGVAMEFRSLGSFEIVGSAGALGLRGAKRRGLLACLVIHSGQPLSTDGLVEELWGYGGSGGAARTVQAYVPSNSRINSEALTMSAGCLSLTDQRIAHASSRRVLVRGEQPHG